MWFRVTFQRSVFHRINSFHSSYFDGGHPLDGTLNRSRVAVDTEYSESLRVALSISHCSVATCARSPAAPFPPLPKWKSPPGFSVYIQSMFYDSLSRSDWRFFVFRSTCPASFHQGPQVSLFFFYYQHFKNMSTLYGAWFQSAISQAVQIAIIFATWPLNGNGIQFWARIDSLICKPSPARWTRVDARESMLQRPSQSGCYPASLSGNGTRGFDNWCRQPRQISRALIAAGRLDRQQPAAQHWYELGAAG